MNNPAKGQGNNLIKGEISVFEFDDLCVKLTRNIGIVIDAIGLRVFHRSPVRKAASFTKIRFRVGRYRADHPVFIGRVGFKVDVQALNFLDSGRPFVRGDFAKGKGGEDNSEEDD